MIKLYIDIIDCFSVKVNNNFYKTEGPKMIKKPCDLTNTDKKMRVLIAGYPGIGKTSLSLSAPKPLLIDVDRGLDRVAAEHRSDYIQPEKCEELLADLTPENIKDYETLIFDTGGQLFRLLGDYVIRRDAKNNSKRDGSLSLQGYGAAAREFEMLVNRAYYTFNKNVVVVFHAKEEKENDTLKLRVLIEGSTKDNVWQPMDLGGFIEMQNGKRIITFANTERHFGKCCHGIDPAYEIPKLGPGEPNVFLTKLFEQVNDNIKKDAELVEKQKEEYTAVMIKITDLVASIKDAATAKEVGDKLKDIEHKITSLKESQILFKGALDKLNLKYNKETGEYSDKATVSVNTQALPAVPVTPEINDKEQPKEATITNAQAKVLFGNTDEGLLKRVMSEFGYEYTKDILKRDFDNILKKLADEKLRATA